jgi:hypothetical protein
VSTTSEFRQYLDAMGQLPPDTVLGMIVMFTITDTPVAAQDLADLFDQNSLNAAYLPPEIKPVDAWKKATSSADGVSYPLSDGTTATILTREVTSTTGYITRHLMREVRDSRRQRLRFDRVADCVFYRASTNPQGKVIKGTERVRLTVDQANLMPEERQRMTDMLDGITDKYNQFYHFLDGQKIRAVVRAYLGYLNSLEIKGGVYFVHSNRVEELLRLQTVVAALPGCHLDLIPLVDLPQARTMIVETFQREAVESLNTLVKDIAHVKGSRKSITADAYAKLEAQYRQVMDRAVEYTRTLEVSQDVTSAAAELALDALTDLKFQMIDPTNNGGTP